MATRSASLCDGWSVISDHPPGCSQKVAVFSLCCDKIHDPKQVGEGRVCLSRRYSPSLRRVGLVSSSMKELKSTEEHCLLTVYGLLSFSLTT